MKPKLEVVGGGNPHFVDALKDYMRHQEHGELRGMAIVALKGDQIITDYVKSDGTTLTELLGAVEIIRQDLIDAMTI